MNNCSLRAGESEASCQVCRGSCPDKSDSGVARSILAAPAEEATGRRVSRPVWDEMKRQAAEANASLDAGDEVSWTAGKELFCPIKFHAFEVGPVEVRTRVRSGETAADAIRRAKAVALSAWAEEYEEKLAGHLERVRRASGRAKGE